MKVFSIGLLCYEIPIFPVLLRNPYGVGKNLSVFSLK
jgi:hypothetical protein